MPKIVDHAQRRADVIAATWQVIADEGMEATTMRRIAEAAGCSTGLVTHYFDSERGHPRGGSTPACSTASKRVHSHLEEPALQALQGVLLDALPLNEEILLEWRVWLIFWSEALTNKYLVAAHDRHYGERAEVVSGLLNAAVAPTRSTRTLISASRPFRPWPAWTASGSRPYSTRHRLPANSFDWRCQTSSSV